MKRKAIRFGPWLVAASAIFSFVPSGRTQQPAGATAASVSSQQAVVNKYCVTCHSDKARTGGLSLQSIDFSNIPAGAETWEKVIRKLNANAMPPQGMPRPDQASTRSLVTYLETELDRAAAAHPNPGRATLHRLNRSEYGNAIHDLLGLDIDTEATSAARGRIVRF